MADKVAIQVDADVAPAIQAYLNLIGKQTQAVNKVRELDRAHSGMKGPGGRSSAAGAPESGMLAGMGMLAGQVAALVGGIGLLKEVLGSYSAQIKDAADRIQKVVEGETAAAGLTGTAEETKAIRDGLRALGAQKVQLKPEELTSIFQAVRNAAPGESLENAMAIVGRAADTKFMVGGDVGAMRNIADYAGRLGAIYQDASAEDRVDIALRMQQELGKYGKRMERSGFLAMEQLVNQGVDPDLAVARAMAAVRAGGTASIVEELTKAAAKPIDVSKVPIDLPEGTDKSVEGVLRGQKAEQMGVIAYNQATEGERVEMLLRNKNLRELAMTAEYSKDLESMMRQGPQALAEGLRGARAGDYVGEQARLAAEGAGREGDLVRQRYEMEARRMKEDLGDVQEMERQVQKERMLTEAQERGATDFGLKMRGVEFDYARTPLDAVSGATGAVLVPLFERLLNGVDRLVKLQEETNQNRTPRDAVEPLGIIF